jgi:hypothetical protein
MFMGDKYDNGLLILSYIRFGCGCDLRAISKRCFGTNVPFFSLFQQPFLVLKWGNNDIEMNAVIL